MPIRQQTFTYLPQKVPYNSVCFFFTYIQVNLISAILSYPPIVDICLRDYELRVTKKLQLATLRPIHKIIHAKFIPEV